MSDSIYADRKDYVGIWNEPVSESAFGYCVTVDCHSRLTNEQAKTDGKCFWCISAELKELEQCKQPEKP